MRKLTTHSKSGLFLMELIISLLFLSLTCTMCIRLFADARLSQKKAQELNHIRELTTSVGEILEGSSPEPEIFSSLLSGGTISGDTVDFYYDNTWSSCDAENAAYQMQLCLSEDSFEKEAGLSFFDSSGEVLYTQTIRFPLFPEERGAAQ